MTINDKELEIKRQPENCCDECLGDGECDSCHRECEKCEGSGMNKKGLKLIEDYEDEVLGAFADFKRQHFGALTESDFVSAWTKFTGGNAPSDTVVSQWREKFEALKKAASYS